MIEEIVGVPCVGVMTYGNITVSSIADDGTEVVLSLLKSEGLFDIANLCSKDKLITVLRCHEDTGIIFVPKKKFIESMAEHKELLTLYFKTCNEKI